MRTIEEMLSATGPLAEKLGPSFEPRPEQVRMAEAVAAAMEARTRLLVEAGTGVGKSFAYLLPAMLRCLEHHEVVVVATNTIALQEQLIRKDVPLLRELLEPADSIPAGQRPRIRPVLVKGRGNYVSIRRLRLASARQDQLFVDPAAKRTLHAIEDWAYHTRDGTLASLPQLERPGVWDKVESDSANCMGRKCPNYELCFYQAARREMERGNLLVCNHALFFSDLAMRAQGAGFLPDYSHVILDEAHGVEDAACDHIGVSLTEGRVNHLLNTLLAPRSNKGYLPQLGLSVGDAQAVANAMTLVDEAQRQSRAFFDSVADLIDRARPASPFARPRPSPDQSNADDNHADELPAATSQLGEGSVRIRRPDAMENPLSHAMQQLALSLRGLRDLTTSEPDRYELNAYALRAQSIAEDAAVLVGQKQEGCVYWAEAGSRGRTRRMTLACAPVEVGPLLEKHLFAGEFSVILTSATLATRGAAPTETRESAETAFSHTMDRLGCVGSATLQLGSPFDYAEQAQLYVDLSLEPPGGGSLALPEYNRLLAQRVLHHVRQTEGGAFVLFTSFATLNAAARQLRGPLEDEGLPLLAQGQDGSREDILERFRRDDRSVLFGAASFWQGVDVRGRSLRNVIITKLPFEPPDRPLTEARGELIRQRGGDPFFEDSLPRAVIRFKQGFGRLIRSRADRGRVVVLDPRIMTARYGKRFLAALPQGLKPTVIRADET